MSQPESYTAAQAADPSTPGQVLADIAALRPDLRPAVASNPATYPGLLDWLKSLGEPAVDAAIAARPAAPTQALPVTPAAPTQPLPAAGGAPPAPSWAGQSTVPSAAPAGPAPGQAAFGAPAPGYGAPPGGMPPGGYTPGYAGTPAPRKSNKTALWIILGIVALLVIGGIVAAIAIFRAAADAVDDDVDQANDLIEETAEPGDLDVSEAMEYGDNAYLDGLWDACAAEDWQACDELYDESAVGSSYEDFGDTCGGQWEAGTTTYCVDAMSGDAGTDDGTDTGDGSEVTAAERIYFDALQGACGAGDWEACDDLFWSSPGGSAYEDFGATCGGIYEGSSMCDTEFGDGVDAEPMTRGSSAGLDALWTACEAGDAEACDLLYWESPSGSDYEAFAQSQG